MEEKNAIHPGLANGFSDRVGLYQQRVNDVIESYLDSQGAISEKLTEAMRYAAIGPGKRIRPLLTYATAEMLGVAIEKADAIAAAVEMIHAYSLVHDDLPAMDDDELRRGRPTLHIAFDEATAILAGDALQALAFQLLADSERFGDDRTACASLVTRLARAVGAAGMAGGQALDLAYSGQTIDRSQLEQVFVCKTGRLISAAILMPLDCASDVDNNTRQALERFADSAGLMFQIHDDVLDVTVSTDQLGKPSGSDERNDRATFPALFGLAAAKARLAELSQEAGTCLDALGDRAAGLRWISDYIVSRQF